MSESLYFRQRLSGRDFATESALARQMANFTYVVGDALTREVLLVDPAYSPRDHLAFLAVQNLTLVGIVATHYHADHIGGDLMGHMVPGIAEIAALVDVPIHVQASEETWVTKGTGLGVPPVLPHEPGDVIRVGSIDITLLHTPGHTQGSQCLSFEGRLVSGDTLFLSGCGRTDLPGSDPREMYVSLQERLAHLPDQTVLYPGHFYSPEPFATLGEVRAHNAVLTPRSVDEWLANFA
ncbi:MAG: MBL fold metallo-hydrolase [Acidimicrobiaceae bacterium]|nr:MBL fold metallo-hydrolase [Acidimicrobiaceae bacterium]